MAADLLVVHHSRGGHTAALTEKVLAGAEAAGGALTVEVSDCFDAGPAEVIEARGVLLGTPARFGYMSGAMKDFLERIYYDCLESTTGKPWALYVKGDTDASGATASVERIVAGLRWRRPLPVLEVVGDLSESSLEAAFELGAAFAAGVEGGLF